MPDSEDLIEHFEAILGHALELGESGGVVLRDRTASWTRDRGSTTSREIGTTGSETKGCDRELLLDVSGVARTNDEGTARLRLKDFFCDFSGPDHVLNFDYPAVFVATPNAKEPTFLTATASPTSDRRNVVVRVATWKPNGTAAANTTFDWRCRVPYRLVPSGPPEG